MTLNINTKSAFMENLADAGCSETTISQCLLLVDENKTSELLNLLSKHRSELLDILHQHQNKIDCLDYLIHKTKKINSKGGNFNEYDF